MAWCGIFSIDGTNKSAAFCEKEGSLCSQREKCKNAVCECGKLELLAACKSGWEGPEDSRQSTLVIRMLHGIS